MNLKFLAFLTTIIMTILIVLSFVFSIPIAYVPNNATVFEFIVLHIIFVLIETVILVSLFVHMLKTAKIDIYDITNLFSSK